MQQPDHFGKRPVHLEHIWCWLFLQRKETMNPSQHERLAAPDAAPRFRGSASPFIMIAGLLAVLPPLAGSGADVQVQLQDPAGLAVPDTRVTARHRTSGQQIDCTTSPEGVCRLDLPLAGAYQISAARNGLEGQLEFLAGFSPTLTVVLEPALMRTAITVVSGSRVEELQEESPVKVEAVSRQEMLSTGYERVSDVLQEIPGVLVRRGSTNTVGGEQVQGLDSRQVLVLMDGLPLVGARGIKSGTLNLHRQTTDRLERVEVAKGAASSHYGSDAIGGVINMITREPRGALDGGFTLSGGSLGMFDARGDIGGRVRNWTWFLNGGQGRMDSYGLLPNSLFTVGPDTRREDLLFKTRAQLTNIWALSFTANGYRNSDRGRNASETGPVEGFNRDSMQTIALVSDLTLTPATMLQLRGYHARYDENSLSTPLGRPGIAEPANLNERFNRLDATLSHQLGRAHFLQGGGEWLQTNYRGMNRLVGDNAGQQITMTDVWLQDKWTPTGRLTVTAGGRVTRHSLFGGAAVPRVGAVYRLSDSWLVRGSFGMGFRAPDLGQLYFRFANPASFYQVIGNPNLNPEHSQSWQTGVQYRRQRYRLQVSLYRNQVRDLIDTFMAGRPATQGQLDQILTQFGIPSFFEPLTGRQTFIYLNRSRIQTQGFEIDGEHALNRQFRIGGAYTYLQAIDRNSRLALPQRHRHQGQIRADYALPRLGLAANVRGGFFSHWMINPALGTRGLPFQIWDVFVSRQWGRGVESFAAIDNFANSRDGKLALAQPTFDRPDFGRTFRVGLRYRITRGD